MTITTQVTHGELVFDVAEDGPLHGEPVVLLHGFPQRADVWDALVPQLTRVGYRTIAVDQRGYSPGARPCADPARRSGEQHTSILKDNSREMNSLQAPAGHRHQGKACRGRHRSCLGEMRNARVSWRAAPSDVADGG